MNRFRIGGVVDAGSAPYVGERGEIRRGFGVQPAVDVDQTIGILFPEPQPPHMGGHIGAVTVLIEQIHQLVRGGPQCFRGVAHRCGHEVRFDLGQFSDVHVLVGLHQRVTDDR